MVLSSQAWNASFWPINLSSWYRPKQWIIKAATVRQKWIDQFESLNPFTEPSKVSRLGYPLTRLECWLSLKF